MFVKKSLICFRGYNSPPTPQPPMLPVNLDFIHLLCPSFGQKLRPNEHISLVEFRKIFLAGPEGASSMDSNLTHSVSPSVRQSVIQPVSQSVSQSVNARYLSLLND